METILEVIDDTLVEPIETIILTLEANNKQIIIGNESSATLTIEDNDVDTVDDHGNTIATATTLTLTVDTSVSGRIDPADDVDYFSIVISTPIFVDIFTIGDLDTIGRLINSVGTELTSDDQSGTNDNFLISRLLERGTYYIEVRSTGTETGNYDLRVDTDDVDVDDHGNTIATATTLTLTVDTSVSGRIDPADDVDYFSIVISTPIFVDIFTIGNDLDTRGILYDGTNTFLQLDDDSGEGNNFLISDRLAQGTYYIGVVSFNSNFIGPYTLHVLTDDHSPTTDRATVLSLNTTVSGTIEREGNVDYFSLEILEMDAPADVNIFTTGDELPTAGRLYDGTNTLLREDNDNSGEGENFLISTRP